MQNKRFLQRRRFAAAAALVVIVGLAVLWVRPAGAQLRARRHLATAPMLLMPGQQVHMACLNGTDRNVGMRFHLMDGLDGMPVMSSMNQIVRPRVVGFFDVFIDLAVMHYIVTELTGNAEALDHIACSVEVTDETGMFLKRTDMATPVSF